MRDCNLLRLLALSGFFSLMLLPHHAAAQWPTLDISSVKEGISTNIELVKQSKVVTDAMTTAGKINAAIGNAKASVSKFAGDNLEKAKEKMKKIQEEKERIEERKKKYKKFQEKLNEKKEAIREYKRQAEALRDTAKGYVDDVKEIKSEVKDYIKDVKEFKNEVSSDLSAAKAKVSSTVGTLSSAKADVSSAVETLSSKPNLNTPTAVVKTTPQTMLSSRTAFGSSEQTPEEYDVAVPTSDAKDYAETPALADSEEAAERNLLEQEPDSAAETEAEDQKEQTSHRPKILDGETSTKMEIPEPHRPKILDTYQAPVDHTPKILEQYRQQSGSNSEGFRKRAVQKTSALQNSRRFASRHFSETLAFADISGDSVPDGTVNGVFILSVRLAQECGIKVADLEDEKIMDKCIKKLVKAKSDSNSAISQEATAVYKTIMQETVNGLVAESMAQKNKAANYETQVLEKLEKKIAKTKNTRDDTGGLSLTNMEIQYLLNRILTIYAARMTLDAIKEIGGFEASYYTEDDDQSGGDEK